MPAAGARQILQLVPIALFPLLACVRAQPCARIYIQGLDSTTTVYPQLAGVYKLQTALVYHWASVFEAYLQYFVVLFVN